MKIEFCFFVTILYCTSLHGQTQADTFKIGNYLEVLNGDSVIIFYNCTGTVVDIKCAEFFRIGKMDSININVSGQFRDYYMNDINDSLICLPKSIINHSAKLTNLHKIALEATMKNDYLNGDATYYYENGNIKSKGKYKLDKKVGEWTYFYENGVKNKTINYNSDSVFIYEYFNKKGKQKVIEGYGKYKGEFNSYMNCSPFTIWGKVKAGKMVGKWTLYNTDIRMKIGHEFFENGQFIKGVSGFDTYIDYPRIYIEGFHANENLHLEKNMLGCPGDTVSFLEYKNNSLNISFYKDLLYSLDNEINKNITNQWLIIRLKVNKENQLAIANVKSSINDIITENAIFKIVNSMREFTSAKVNGENIDFDLFFTILIRNGKLIIPDDYIYENR